MRLRVPRCLVPRCLARLSSLTVQAEFNMAMPSGACRREHPEAQPCFCSAPLQAGTRASASPPAAPPALLMHAASNQPTRLASA